MGAPAISTYSMWSLFRNCRKAFEWRYLEELVPLERDRNLALGTVIHQCLEVWHSTRQLDAVLDTIDRAYPNRDQEADEKRDWHLATAMMRGYATRYTDEEFEVVALEKTFEGKIVNPSDCSGPVKASLLFRQRNSEGVPVAEAGVNATTVPAGRFVTFAEQAESMTGTGVAYANPSAAAALVTFTARNEAGQTLASEDLTLLPGGHGAQNMASLFGLNSFTGSLEVTSTEPIVSLSLNAEAAPVFSSLPPDLLEKCTRALREAPAIPKARLQWRKADIAIGQSGVEATETAGSATVVLDEAYIELPDVLTELQDRTQLTRRSIQRILSASRRLDDFKRNPQQFIELAELAINRCKQQALVDGIKYQRLGDEHYYAQELFEKEELTGYLKNMLDASKSVYEKVVYESAIEATFADQLEKNTAVQVYAKLPGWFAVPTPLGSYNPDWAVLIDSDEGERLYFVVETKRNSSSPPNPEVGKPESPS